MGILGNKKFWVTVGISVMGALIVVGVSGKKEQPVQSPVPVPNNEKDFRVDEVDGKKVITPQYETKEEVVDDGKATIDEMEMMRNMALDFVTEVSEKDSAGSFENKVNNIRGAKDTVKHMFSLRRKYNKMLSGIENSPFERPLRAKIEQSMQSQIFTINERETVVKDKRVDICIDVEYNTFSEDHLESEWKRLRRESEPSVSDDELTMKVIEDLGEYLSTIRSLRHERMYVSFVKLHDGWKISRSKA